jgi:hypothetical protein
MVSERRRETMSKSVMIEVQSVGTNFGCVGIVRDAQSREKLAETDVKPNSMRGVAYTAAESIATDRGWTVADAG